MNDRTRLIIGGYYEIPGVFRDADENAIDMTVADRIGKLWLIPIGGSVALQLSTENAADWTWSVQASGSGYWLFTTARTSALDAGPYVAEVRYEDGASTKPHLVGKARYTFYESSTGIV